MRFLTHIVGGVAAGLFITNFYPGILIIAVAAIASGIPDIDTPKSKYGRRIQPFSIIFAAFLKHRGVFHSLLAAILLSLPLYIIEQSWGIAFFAGYISHLVLDSLNKKGTKPLWPLPLKTKGPIKNGSVGEFLILTLLVAAIIVQIIF